MYYIVFRYSVLFRTYYSSGGEDYFSNEDREGDDSTDNDDGQLDDSDKESDSVEACSCSLDEREVQSDDSIDADDLFTVYVGIEEADPVCIKIQDLIRRGKISRERILYKYLNDVLEVMYNPFHQYDQEVVEFFNTITYLGGRRTTCFIRGPMNLGDGRNSHARLSEKKMNLGGPSESVCAKYQAGYTPESGVIKPLSLGHMTLLKNSEAKPLIATPKLTVIPCAFANDGTALKPAIEFDPRLKQNIGLTTPVDLRYALENPTPSPDYLKENIVTEAIVSSLTSLDNFCSLPVAVDYTSQGGKTGEFMVNFFQEHIKTLQTCESCQEKTPHRRHIISSLEPQCNSYCEECYQSREVCDDCKSIGQVSHLPSLRFCASCQNKNKVCFRRVVMIVCSDCESGNKSAFEMLQEKLEAHTEEPELAVLSVLPDCPHVGKSIKAAFANWWLKCKGERINLALIRTLRNRSDKETKDIFRKLIPMNDHVKNKDRQDPSSVLTLSSTKLTDELKNAGYICHTIIPELDKYSADNQRGMFPSPISVAIPSYGWVAFLSFDAKSSLCTLYKARLHSPVDKISAIGKNLTAKAIHSSGGIIFLTSDGGPIKAIPFAEGAIDIMSKLKKKDDFINLARRLKLSSVGTVKELKDRLKRYSTSLKSRYEQNNIQPDEVHFWNFDTQPSFESMVCVDEDLIYAARDDSQVIVSFQVEKDGVGLRGINMQEVIKYRNTWRKVYSMCLSGRSIFLSHCEGISKVSLETDESVNIVQLINQPCMMTTFSSEVLFTNQMKASVWKIKTSGEVELFAGCQSEEGSIDGKVKKCRFRQPIGICAESESVIYITDAQTNSIKICSTMVECAKFLDSIGKLYDAFSIHSKGKNYTVKPADEALSLVRHCKALLDENTEDIRINTGITGALNGPQGHVSAKTVASVGLMEWGLQRLYDNLKPFNYSATNLLSCMTLDIENCHSTVHIKQANMSMMEYSRSFGLTMKEAVKRMTHWAAYYHTSKKSWYPKPEETLHFSQLPTITPLPAVEMSKTNCDILRDWASTYGAAVRQRTVRQETTMAKHGTLPEYMYQRHCIVSENPVHVFPEEPDQVVDPSGQDSDTDCSVKPVEDEDEFEDAEFDESSDEEEGSEQEDGDSEIGIHGEIGSSTTFLIGVRSRFGRAIRFNNRLLS